METNRPRFTAPTPESLSNACKHVDFQLGNDMQYPDLTAQLGVQSDSKCEATRREREEGRRQRLSLF